MGALAAPVEISSPGSRLLRGFLGLDCALPTLLGTLELLADWLAEVRLDWLRLFRLCPVLDGGREVVAAGRFPLTD